MFVEYEWRRTMTFSFEEPGYQKVSKNLVIAVTQEGQHLMKIEVPPLQLQQQVINTLAEGIGDAIGLARSKEKRS